MEKIILFGGTFDPVHNGHIAVAISALQSIGASKIILIPARRSPHKHQKPFASDDDRLMMLRLAVSDEKQFEVSPVELNRGEPSYTIDTIRLLKQKTKHNAQFCWLLGADMLKDLPKWYKINELLNECSFCVMNRGGFEKPDFNSLAGKLSEQAIEKLRKDQIQTPLINISSTGIRKRVADGQDIRELVHPAVLDFIIKHKLYTLDHQLSRHEDI